MLAPLSTGQQAWVDATLDAMTLPQCVGQLLCPTSRRSTTEDWLALLKEVPLGAMTVRGVSTQSHREHMHRLQAASDVPILVAGDLEHGAVALTDGTEFPWMMAAGAADDTTLMRAMGQATAAEGRYAGVHITFSPVVDLNFNFNNPITNVRALSDDPDRVIRLAGAYIQGLQENGLMAATAKHFPGDGMDDRDQHLSTTVNNLSFARWQETYGRVWQDMVDAGVMCIMPGHISLPDYQGYADRPEDAPPATLSPKLLLELLRGELGYNGLLISDASAMIGVTARISRDEQVVACIESGLDLYLFPETCADYRRLLQAVESGRLSEERVRAAARRVLTLKARLNLYKDPFGPQPAAAEKETYQQAAHSMADKSITILRPDPARSLSLSKDARILTVTIAQVSAFNKFMSTPELDVFDDELRQRGFQVVHLLNPEDELLSAKAAECDVVFLNLVALPYMMMGAIRNLVGHLGHWKWRSLHQDHPRVFITSFGSPYVLHELPHIPNLLAAYGDSAVSQRAAVKVWLGEIEVQGECPVRLPQITIKR